MNKRVNNTYNMKLIRKAMVDLDLNNIKELGDYLYISETALRLRLNGDSMVNKRDLEFMEHKLNIKFDWDSIHHVKGNYYRFFERPTKVVFA